MSGWRWNMAPGFTLEVNAELAGVDLSGSKLEGYARTVIRSKNMLQIIKNALNTVRLEIVQF